jgi:hypothetical protein
MLTPAWKLREPPFARVEVYGPVDGVSGAN